MAREKRAFEVLVNEVNEGSEVAACAAKRAARTVSRWMSTGRAT